MRTKVSLIADVLQTAGADSADKVRNFIKKEYEDHKVVFVVLGGDVEQIPYVRLYSESYDHNQTPDRLRKVYSGADMYFGTLDGNWNPNNNEMYGEPGEEDMFWEVYVSRFPVDSNAQLENILNKTIHYSETPHRDQVNNVLMVSSFLWDDYGNTIWGADNIEYYVGYKDAYGWQTFGFPENKFDLTWLTDKESGAAAGWTGKDLKAKILTDKPAWIDHNGHSSTTYVFNIPSSRICSTFVNTGAEQNYHIIFCGACYPGQFRVSDCFMEHMINSEMGAVATVSDWDNVMDDDDDNNSPSCLSMRFMHDALFNPNKRVHFLESMHAMGKEALVAVSTNPDAINVAPYYGLLRYVSYNTNLFGDPALSVWSETPKDLTEPFEYTANTQKFTMNTPPYTWVALADPVTNEIFTTQLTGYKYNQNESFIVGDSTCMINDDEYKAKYSSLSSIKMIIKAHNYLPAEFTFPTSVTQSKLNNTLKQFMVKVINSRIVINFILQKKELVNLSLYNVKGALIKTVVNEKLNSGNNQFNYNSGTLSSGVYYCTLKYSNTCATVKFLVFK